MTAAIKGMTTTVPASQIWRRTLPWRRAQDFNDDFCDLGLGITDCFCRNVKFGFGILEKILKWNHEFGYFWCNFFALKILIAGVNGVADLI